MRVIWRGGWLRLCDVYVGGREVESLRFWLVGEMVKLGL